MSEIIRGNNNGALGATRQQGSILLSPLVVLVLVLAACALLLSLPLSLPIGPMYWDLFIYFDAANRIFDGQVPIVDFFAPVGPLGYYLFAWWLKVFSDAHPLLLVDWSLFTVTAPLMALVLWQVDARSRGVAFAILIPFLAFSLLPFNTRPYYPYPGSDGFGIYNRQICQLLYVLVASLVFVRGQRLLAFLVTVTMTALFLTKITGFLAGLLLCAFAFVAGRFALRYAIASAVVFFAALGALELWNGMISQYAIDIMALVRENTDTLLPRVLQAASHSFGIIAPGGILMLVLLWADRLHLGDQWHALKKHPTASSIASIVDHDAFWLGAILLAGLFFETQNTGSQALIFLWPLLVSLLAARLPMASAAPKLFSAIVLLAAAAALPPLVNTVEQAARTYVGSIKNVPLENKNLETLGRVNMRPTIAARSDKMIDFYVRHRETYADFVRIGELPSYVYYSEFHFQIVHLMAMDRVIDDIRALEAEKDIRFETIMSLNFVNPFPYLMDRSAPKHITIGADPMRAVPPPSPEQLAAVADTDLVLYPTCPLTTSSDRLEELYEPGLQDHRRITIDPCYDAYVHPRFDDALD